ncbi:MAG: LytR C-terminal domain-containing protein [Actinomycetota bacterium]|nr:LytR C-terminal domain-containing protein [Actinomycetota bacterium]
MKRAARPRHATEDGSFGRSAGIAAGRGAALLAVALLLGFVLLRAGDEAPADRVTAGDPTEETLPPVTDVVEPPTVAPTAPARPPREVRVLSVNGTDVSGVARRITDQLRQAGYNVLAPADVEAVNASAVYYAAGFEREAQAVGEALGLPVTVVQALPTPPPLPNVRGANVLVVVGPDLAQRVAGTTTTTTTTARRTSSTSARSATTTSSTTTRP